jgi:hypothetical protein
VTCCVRSQYIRGSLLGNSFVNTQQYWSVARQQPARNNGSTVGSGILFSMWFAPRLYHAIDSSKQFRINRVEAGSNTSTVTLRVVGGDEKGSLKTETVKCGREIQGTPTRERLRWLGPVAYIKDRPVSRQRGRPTETRPQLSVINIWS